MKSLTLLLLLLTSSYANSISAQQQMEYAFHFESAQSELPKTAKKAIASIAQQAKNWTGHHIIIHGHTDNVGVPNYNKTLSKARAEEVKSLFTKAGIGPNRILVKAMGETYPLASNQYEEGRKQNRRVEIILTSKNKVDYLEQQVRNKLVLEQLKEPSPSFTVFQTALEQYIETPKGTKILIPAHAFDVAEGSQVEIKVTEAFKKSEMILQGLSTMSNGKQLITGGMLKVEAFADGKQVGMKDGKSLHINLPSKNPDSRMQLFYSDESAKEINWVQPQALLVNKADQADSLAAKNSALFADNSSLYNYDTRYYYGSRKLTPRQLIAKKSKRYLNRLELKPLDFSTTIRRPTAPAKVDSSNLIYSQNQLTSVRKEINSPCNTFGCKFRAFFRSKKRKEAIKQEGIARINSIKEDIDHYQKQLALQHERQAEYVVDVKNYLKKKEKCKRDYEKQMVGFDEKLEGLDSINFIYAIYNTDISYLHHKYPTREKEACQRMFRVNTFEEAVAAKKQKGLVAYLKYFLPERNPMKRADIYAFVDQFPSDKAMDKQFYRLAIEKRDTNYIKWRKGRRASKLALLEMYDATTMKEVRDSQLAQHLAEHRQYYEDKMELYGVGSIEEVYIAEQNLKRKKREWKSQTGYVFNTAKLGNWINCDYFPGKSNTPMITQNFELPISPNAASTYLIFRDIASVMSGSPSYDNFNNNYSFNNIPEGKSVQVLSYYMDIEGKTHVAIKTINAQGDAAEKLVYKKMSMEEFKATLLALDV